LGSYLNGAYYPIDWSRVASDTRRPCEKSTSSRVESR
jgi:hypothetical protein